MGSWSKLMKDWGWYDHHIMPALRDALAKFGRAVVAELFKIAGGGRTPGKYLRWLFRNWGGDRTCDKMERVDSATEEKPEVNAAKAHDSNNVGNSEIAPDPIARAHKALKGGATLAAVNIIMQALDGLSLAAVQRVCAQAVGKGMNLDEFRGAVLGVS